MSFELGSFEDNLFRNPSYYSFGQRLASYVSIAVGALAPIVATKYAADPFVAETPTNEAILWGASLVANALTMIKNRSYGTMGFGALTGVVITSQVIEGSRNKKQRLENLAA